MSYMDPRPEGLNTEPAPPSVVETLRTPDLNTVTFDASQWQLVPKVPSSEMLDSAVSFALNVKISGSYNWSAYMGDLWRQMLAAAPTPAAQSAGQEAVAEVRDNPDDIGTIIETLGERPLPVGMKLYAAPVNGGEREALRALVEMIDAGRSADYAALQEHRVMRLARAAQSGQRAGVALLDRIRQLATEGMCHGLLADDKCREILEALDGNAIEMMDTSSQKQRTVIHACPVCNATLERKE